MMSRQDLLDMREQILGDRLRLASMLETGCNRRKAEALLQGLATHLDIIDTFLASLAFSLPSPCTGLQK